MDFVDHKFNWNCVQIIVIVAFRWSLKRKKDKRCLLLKEMPASINRVVSSVKFRTLKTVSEFVSLLSAFIVRLWCNSVCEFCVYCCWPFACVGAIGAGRVVLLLLVWRKLRLRSHLKIVRLLESKKFLAKAYIMLYRVWNLPAEGGRSGLNVSELCEVCISFWLCCYRMLCL
jgi:hypothetical protein